ncbi:autoinducer binding domain-containing protein [Rhizobium leguminosarum]
MERPERAVDDCAEDAAFSPSKAVGAGASFNDGKERLAEMAKLAGFDFYLLSVFPRGDRKAFIENRLISNWPLSLVGFYEAADLFYCSRLVTAMKRTIAPISCKEGSFAGSAANKENRRLNTLFQMHGLKNTFAFALHDADLKQYIFAFLRRLSYAHAGAGDGAFTAAWSFWTRFRAMATRKRSVGDAHPARNRMPATPPDSLNRNRLKESGGNSKCYSVLCASKKTRGAVVGGRQEQRRDRDHSRSLVAYGGRLSEERDAQTRFGQPHAGGRQSIPVPDALKRVASRFRSLFYACRFRKTAAHFSATCTRQPVSSHKA